MSSATKQQLVEDGRYSRKESTVPLTSTATEAIISMASEILAASFGLA